MLYETAEHAVFIDPLAVEDDGAFWSWADERCRGREVVALETILYHRRSRDEFLARYSATTKAPESVESYLFPVAEETVFWIPEHRALVPGDVLLGTGGGEPAPRGRRRAPDRRAGRGPARRRARAARRAPRATRRASVSR